MCIASSLDQHLCRYWGKDYLNCFSDCSTSIWISTRIDYDNRFNALLATKYYNTSSVTTYTRHSFYVDSRWIRFIKCFKRNWWKDELSFRNCRITWRFLMLQTIKFIFFTLDQCFCDSWVNMLHDYNGSTLFHCNRHSIQSTWIFKTDTPNISRFCKCFVSFYNICLHYFWCDNWRYFTRSIRRD